MLQSYLKTFEQLKATFLNVWLILIGTLVAMNVDKMPNNFYSTGKISNIIMATVISVLMIDRSVDWVKINKYRESLRWFCWAIIPTTWLALMFDSVIRKPFISFSITFSYYAFMIIVVVISVNFQARLLSLGSEKKEK